MFISQSELFKGLDKNFVRKLMEISKKESYRGGTFLFCEGDPAEHFFVILKGHIRLIAGNSRLDVFESRQAGDAFGWSGLVGREEYSSTCECVEDTTLVRFAIKDIRQITAGDPAGGMAFFRMLAGMLGGRLIQLYKKMDAICEGIAE